MHRATAAWDEKTGVKLELCKVFTGLHFYGKKDLELVCGYTKKKIEKK